MRFSLAASFIATLGSEVIAPAHGASIGSFGQGSALLSPLARVFGGNSGSGNTVVSSSAKVTTTTTTTQAKTTLVTSSSTTAVRTTFATTSSSSAAAPVVVATTSSSAAPIVPATTSTLVAAPLTSSTSSAMPAATSAASTGRASAVLFPAYIYPDVGAWQPLFDAAKNYPNVIFHVIINPNSGPDGSTPNADYTAAIQQLNTYPNVLMIGYVHVSYTQRAIADVNADVQSYANWATLGMGMDGIFFDEAPDQADPTSLAYMKNVTDSSRLTLGASGTVNPIAYFNPGTICDAAYYKIADYIAAFENSYNNFLSSAKQFAPSSTTLPMSQTSAFVYEVPSSWNQANMTSFVKLLSKQDGFASIFLTNNPGSAAYNTFGADWTQFVAAVDAARTA